MILIDLASLIAMLLGNINTNGGNIMDLILTASVPFIIAILAPVLIIGAVKIWDLIVNR